MPGSVVGLYWVIGLQLRINRDLISLELIIFQSKHIYEQ